MIVSVLLPTRNSIPYLRDHVERVRGWLDLVDELIVVDSESTDGTAEYLQEKLAGPKLRFYNRPPGLYESWNFGIARARARYIYISTVGDGVGREGIAHLIEIAEQQNADVVVSPPRFIFEGRRKPGRYEWPIHWLIENAGITEPREIPAMQAFLITLLFAPSGILGSSASNLYRTDTIQGHPFPLGFGHQGDTAWALQNAFQVRWSLTPRVLSDFVVHGQSHGQMRERSIVLKPRLFQLAGESWSAYRAGLPVAKGNSLDSELYIDLESVLNKLAPLEEELVRLRNGLISWSLRPHAWRIRRMRDSLKLPLRKIADRIAALPPLVNSNESCNRKSS